MLKVSADEFLSFVASVLNVDRAAISLDTTYGVLPEWDSVMHLRLVMEIGDRFSVDVPFEKVPELTTLGAFYDYLTEGA